MKENGPGTFHMGMENKHGQKMEKYLPIKASFKMVRKMDLVNIYFKMYGSMKEHF